MRFTLIAPASGAFWKSQLSAGVLITPQNEGFEQDAIIGRLQALREAGHSYEVIDGEQLSQEERGRIYIEKAIPAAGTDYNVRQTFGSQKHSPARGDFFGTMVPVLLVADGDRAVDVVPHQRTDGSYLTIRRYLDEF